MADFSDLYKRYGGIDPPPSDQSTASSTTAAPPTDYWDDLHRRYGVIPQQPTPEQTAAGYAVIPTPGGISVVDTTVPTTTTKAEEVKRGGELAKTTEAAKAPLEQSSEPGLTPGGAGFRIGTMDVRQGAEKLVRASGSSLGVMDAEPDYANRVRDASERRMLEQEMQEAPAAGFIGRLGGQALTGAVPAGIAVNRVAGALPGVGNFLLGRAGQNALTRGASMGSQGALQGTTGAAITSGQSNQPLGEQVLEGGIGGAALGAGLGTLGSGALNATSRMDPEVARLADIAVNKYGMDALRASQVTENPLIRKVDQITGQFPLSGAASRDAELRSQFTRAVANTFGESTDKITSPVVQRAQRQLGGVLNKIETSNDVNLGHVFNDFVDIDHNISLLPDAGEQKVLRNMIDTVFSQLKPGDTISGTQFGQLIHKGSQLDKLTSSPNPNISNVASDIKSTLRDALQQSLPADQAALYSQTRGQYRNLMTVLPLVNKSPTGYISPTALNQAVTTSFTPRRRALQGAGDLGDLGFIGQQFIKEPRDSGTPMGMLMQQIIGHPGALLAGTALGAGGASYAGYLDPHSLLALPATMAIARAMRIPMNSATLRDAAINQALGRPINPLLLGAGASAGPNLLGTQTNQLLGSPQQPTP